MGLMINLAMEQARHPIISTRAAHTFTRMRIAISPISRKMSV
jgi:hypothetical protein